MPSRSRTVTVRVRKQGPNLYVEMPVSVSKAFTQYAEKGRIRVYGTLQGAEIRGNLVPRGGGHRLFVHAGMKAAAGIELGDRVELTLRAVPWSQVPIAKDVRAVLKRDGVLETFEAKSPSQRHELLRWVEVADSVEKRAKRLAEMAKQLKGRTEPVKKGQVAKRLKPLWECPKCGHVFVNTNQWHSCRRYSLDDAFASSSAPVRELFERLRDLVESVGPVRVQAYRDHVAFIVRVRFMGATPKKKWLDVGFWFNRRIDNPRFHKVETLTPSDHIHLLRVTAVEELDDEVLGWIRKGHAVGEQRHLA